MYDNLYTNTHYYYYFNVIDYFNVIRNKIMLILIIHDYINVVMGS